MPDLNVIRTEYSQANKTVTVEGTAGTGITVRALLNPNLTGYPSDQAIYQNWAVIPALDRKEKVNAATFLLVLNAGDSQGPFEVKVVTANSKGNLIPVPYANPQPGGGGTPGGGTPGGTTTLPGGS
jgi:hypothetical protein